MYMVFTFIRRRWVVFGALCLLLLCLVFVPQFAFANAVADGMTSVIYALVGALMKALEWLVSLFQFLFLQVIQFTVLDFANQWKDDGLLSDFRVVWQILRDFVNLVIVVFFVLTAMMTVLDAKGQFGFHRKGLVWLIVAAVFVNFSAFFTLLVIDVSHILFMLFFNALDVSTLGSFSPFSGYSEVLGSTADGFFNVILGVVASLVNWFIILGILYFCIILIERYIIAMFLVLFSPLAALGFFTNMSGGNPLANKFSGLYKTWSERLGYVFTMPVVLIVGFALLLVLFRGALGQMVDPDNFVKLIGVNTPEGRSILLQLMLASIVLILGIFKVGEVAKEANIHPALAKKFKFGEFMSGQAKSLAKGKPLGKPLLGALRTIRNPAGRGVFGYKQKLYDQRKKWQQDQAAGKKVSWVAKVPGVGKSLDVGGKVRRTTQRAQSVVRGVNAVAGGQSGRNVAWQNAEANEDQRIWGIIRDPKSTREQKQELLRQALDDKSNVTLNERQTAELARNIELHPLISSLKKGVSQGTFKQMQNDAKARAKDLVSEQESIVAEKADPPIAYKAREQRVEVTKAEYDEAGSLHADLMKQKNLAQENHKVSEEQAKAEVAEAQREYDESSRDARAEYDKAKELFERTATYKDFEQQKKQQEQDLDAAKQSGADAERIKNMEKSIKDFEKNFYKNTAPAESTFTAVQQKSGVLEGMQSDLQNKKDSIQEKLSQSPTAVVLRETEDALRAANGAKKSAHDTWQRAEREFEGVKSRYEDPLEQREATNADSRRRVAQVFSNLATNTAAGVAVSGDAAAVFDPNELADAREKRESIAAPIDEQFQKMKNDYAKASAAALEDFEAEQTALKEKNAEEDAEILKKREEYAKEEMQNPDSDELTDRMKELQEEIDTLGKAAVARRERSLAIDLERDRIRSVRNNLEKRDVSDAEKITILGESVKSAKSFVQDGTQYLTAQLKIVADKVAVAEEAGADPYTDGEYKDLLDEQDRITNRLGYVSRVGDGIVGVGESLDEYRSILESSEYTGSLNLEQYLTMFSVKTLLRDIDSAMAIRKKKFNDKYLAKERKRMKEEGEEGKPKLQKNGYKEDPQWKMLDQQKKNLKKIQAEGGASAELQQAAVKAAEQLAKQQGQKKKQQKK